jgi:hypothetical protein
MQPYSQPFFWIQQPALNQPNSEQYWLNGLPEPGLHRAAQDAGAIKFWANGLPATVIKSA